MVLHVPSDEGTSLFLRRFRTSLFLRRFCTWFKVGFNRLFCLFKRFDLHSRHVNFINMAIKVSFSALIVTVRAMRGVSFAFMSANRMN